MAKNITVPPEVKEFLKQPQVSELLKKDDLQTLYNNMQRDHDRSWRDFGLDSEFHRIVWEVFVLAGINLADGFRVLPSVLAYADSISKIDLTGTKATAIDAGFATGSSLEEVIIGDNIVTIGPSAFEDCKKLKTVVIGDSVQKIGDRAFANCPNLDRIYLPESVRLIGRDALKAHENCYIMSPPRKPGSLHILGDTTWLRTHLGVDPRYREVEEEVVESEE